MSREMSISDLAIARDERVGELVDGLETALDIIVWMSGSPSFAPNGEAHVGWVANRAKLDALFKLIAKAEGSRTTRED